MMMKCIVDDGRWVVDGGRQWGWAITQQLHFKIRPLLEIGKFDRALTETQLGAVVSVNLQRVKIENITSGLESEISLSPRMQSQPLWQTAQLEQISRRWQKSQALFLIMPSDWIKENTYLYAVWLIAPLPQIKESGIRTSLIISILTDADYW